MNAAWWCGGRRRHSTPTIYLKYSDRRAIVSSRTRLEINNFAPKMRQTSRTSVHQHRHSIENLSKEAPEFSYCTCIGTVLQFRRIGAIGIRDISGLAIPPGVQDAVPPGFRGDAGHPKPSGYFSSRWRARRPRGFLPRSQTFFRPHTHRRGSDLIFSSSCPPLHLVVLRSSRSAEVLLFAVLGSRAFRSLVRALYSLLLPRLLLLLILPYYYESLLRVVAIRGRPVFCIFTDQARLVACSGRCLVECQESPELKIAPYIGDRERLSE